MDFSLLVNAGEQGDGSAIFDAIARAYEEEGQFALVFEARVLQKRFDLGLPLVGDVASLDLDDGVRATLETHYESLCREIGQKFLDRGDLGQAFAYFQTVQDLEPIGAALDAWADRSSEEREPVLESLLEIGLGQGVRPELGYRWMLEHRGICDSISFLEQHASLDPSVRRRLVGTLVRAMHRELNESLQRDLVEHEGTRVEVPLVEILKGRRWLFRNNRCHVDDSHLQASIRFAVTLEDREGLSLAEELCVYGMHLPPTYQHSEGCPFEDFYNDYRVLLRGLNGVESDRAVEHFAHKLTKQTEENPRATHFPAEILAFLQHRTQQHAGAIETFRAHLSQSPRLSLCPPLLELCRAAHDFGPFLEATLEKGNALQYAIGLIEKYQLGS
ncbi:MAG: hypothetical protein AAF488_09790 [Planctomycetota bacterium]